MHSTSIISFLLLLLTPLFVFAQDTTAAPSAAETSLSSTTTVRTTVTSTQVTFVTMTGVPPSSTATGNGTSLETGSPSAVPFVGAAPGAFRVSAGMGAVVLGAAFWLL